MVRERFSLNRSRTNSIRTLIRTSAECARPKRAVLMGGHLRASQSPKIVSLGGDGVRTLPPFFPAADNRPNGFRKATAILGTAEL